MNVDPFGLEMADPSASSLLSRVLANCEVQQIDADKERVEGNEKNDGNYGGNSNEALDESQLVELVLAVRSLVVLVTTAIRAVHVPSAITA